MRVSHVPPAVRPVCRRDRRTLSPHRPPARSSPVLGLVDPIPAPQVVASLSSVHDLLHTIEDSSIWDGIEEAMPGLISYNPSDPRYEALNAEIRAWSQCAARTLCYRTHFFSYRSFMPPPATSDDRQIASRLMNLDRQIKNLWSHRVGQCRRLFVEIRRLVAGGLLNARILLDPAIIILPDDSARYPWNPDFISGAASLEDQLASLDRRDPWRLYFTGDPAAHPTRHFGYDTALCGAFEPGSPCAAPSIVAPRVDLPGFRFSGVYSIST